MQRAQQLGRYHLLDRIAFGGMAEIYRAKTFDSEGHVHLVAVKRVLAHLVEDDDFIQMLVDEAKIASLLANANIARVYEFARASGEYFIAMEYVDGKDVRTILERCRQKGKPVPPQHAAWIAAEVAGALTTAHTANDSAGRSLRIVHRDVSPSNVLCAYTGEVKLCDFGIAKATLSRVQTKTGVIKGKVKYMSPEQAMGRKLDHRSDIFSLGSVLYEMLTKIPPFTAANEMDLLIKVRDAKYRAIRDIEPDVPEALCDIVDRALTRSRTARFQSADEVAIALRAFLADYQPGYSRSYLSRYLRKMFEVEIERELRLLEDYVISAPDPANVGENLIADVLGPDAPYSKFTPIATPDQVAGQTGSIAHDGVPEEIEETGPGGTGPGETGPGGTRPGRAGNGTYERTGVITPAERAPSARPARAPSARPPTSAPPLARASSQLPTTNAPRPGTPVPPDRGAVARGKGPPPPPAAAMAPRSSEEKQNLSSATTIPASMREPERELPPGVDLHSAETMIIDRNKGARAAPGGGGRNAPAERARPAPPRHPGSPGGRDPKDLDPAIHDSPTLILHDVTRRKGDR